MIFAPLHIYSGYSFLKSGLTIEKIIASIKSNDYFGAALTDRGSLFGIPRFIHSMEKINKKYLVGMEVTYDENVICLYATNEVSYRNLCIISSEIQKLTNQKSENIDSFLKDLFDKYHEGIIAILDSNHGKIKELFLSVTTDETSIARYVNDISKMFEMFYIGIEIKERSELNHAQRMRKFAREHTYECVAFPHIKYQKEEDAISLKIVEAIKNDERIKEKALKGNEYFFKEEYLARIYTKEELENTIKIVNQNQFNYHQKRGEMLHYPVPNSEQYLRDICYSRLKELSLDNNEIYITRLEYELSTVIKMGYADYFLLVQDYFLWAKNNDIMVSIRGSSVGSLIIYLLGMTSLDPIKYGLHFERFLNESRKSLPDIDVDFMDTRRGEVVDYCREKYGIDKVSNIITFQTILAKQSLRDIGRIYGYPNQHIDLLSKRLTNKNYSLRESYKQLPAFKELIDSDPYFLEIVSLASKIEGLPRQSSLHAAGVLLNNTSIEGKLPVTVDLSDNYISQYEMGYLEEQGFLKMDFLGLNYLTITSNCVDLINKHYPNIDLDKFDIPFQDKESIKLIKDGLTMGIFQLESSGMKNAIKTLKPETFEDIAALLALFRPGPMAFIPSYAKRKEKKEIIPPMDEKIEKILGSTYGIIVYQEQVSELAVAMAGMTMVEADNFRSAISKKKADVLKAMHDSFISGCLKNGYSKNDAIDYYNRIEKFASYGFNKSHSYTYAKLSCEMAYLKKHYPLEFYSTILANSAMSKDAKFNEYISEMRRLNIKILPPDINQSSSNFEIKNGTLLFPLTAIKDINELTAKKILEIRKNGSFTDFFDFIVKIMPLKMNNEQINRLIDSGALDAFHNNRASLKASLLSALQYAEVTSGSDQLTLALNIEKPLLVEVSEDRNERLDNEYKAIGIMLSDNPLSLRRKELETKGLITILDALDNTSRREVSLAVIIRSKKVINTKKGVPMAFVKVFDETGEMEINVFPEVYQKHLSQFEKNNIVVVTGFFEMHDGEKSFIARDVKQLEEE